MRLPLLCALTLLICFSPRSQAQSADGGDAFVNAYVTAQQGEKAEQAGNFKVALAKLREAARDLDAIATKYPSWSPSIVKYRKDRTAEAIVRVQEKLAHFGPGHADTGPETGPTPDQQPPLPEKGLLFDKAPDEIVIPPDTNPPPADNPTPRRQRGQKSAPPADDGDVSGVLNKVDQRLKDLEKQLSAAHQEIDQMQADKLSIAKKLDEAKKAREASEKQRALLENRANLAEAALQSAKNEGSANAERLALLQKESSDAKKLLTNAKIEAEADAEYRRQLDERYKAQLNRISVLTKERDDARSVNASAPGKIEAIQKQLDATKKEKEALALKLQTMETQLTEVSKQRDDALAQVSKLKDAQKQVDKLVADNASLMAKLTDAQNSVAQFKAEGADKDKQIADLKKEVVSVRQQLEDTKKASAEFQRKMGDLQERLEATAKQLADTKSDNAANAAEQKKMQEENRILRDIVLREQRKEADRQAMKKVVLGELSKLEINSKTLLKQIDFLSEPILKLTAKERALFKKPELQVSDTDISIALPKDDSPAAAASPTGQVNPEISVIDEPKATPSKAPEKKRQEPVSTPTVAIASTPPAVVPAPAPPPVPTPTAAPKRSVASAATPTPKPTPAIAAKPPKSTPEPPKIEDSQQPLITLNQPASNVPSLARASNTTSASPLFDTRPGIGDAAAPAPSSVSPPPAEETPKNVDQSAPPLVTPDNAPNTANTPPVPAEFVPLARQGKEQFERGNYLEAEKSYRKILAKAPRNLYALSNLGVVLFRSGKYKLAEEMFNKAIAVAPEDGFSHCTLGIVYYQETKLDEAVNELTKALAINPQNPTAHNYLGITASQKGWPEAAQKELETAVSLDANYADAYFNLAVVFATQQPPNKEEARRCYKRAVELGAEADPALEQLIK
jgi:Flp pilus assembly protein TadD